MTFRASAEMVAVERVPLRIRESERRIDQTPPSRPTIEVRTIRRGEGAIQLGNGTWVDRSESDFGTITLLVGNVSDDRTPADSLGYQLAVVDGTLPDGLTIPEIAFVQPNREPYFYWGDGATWDQEPFSFRVVLKLVDWAGNESAPSDTLTIANDGDTTDARLKWEQEFR